LSFYVEFSAPGRGLKGGKGRLHKMSYGSNAITPRNLGQMLSRMQAESGGNSTTKTISVTKQWGSSTPQLLQGLGRNEVLNTAPAPASPPPKTIVITKDTNVSSPLLWNVSYANEVLDPIIISLTHSNSSGGGGQEQVVSRITLTNASVVKYTRFAPSLATSTRQPTPAGSGLRNVPVAAVIPGSALANELEEIHLTFQKISFEPGQATSTSDDWTSNNK
jgi:type VI protein secretion system component Hcp